jgi:hypothetical protein
MMIQCVPVKAAKVPEEKTAVALKSHLKYLQYRQHNLEPMQKKDRQFFNDQSDHIDRHWIQRSIMCGQKGNVYYYRLLLSPAYDEPVSNWRHWTRAVLRDLENRFGQTLNWYAIEHSDNDHSHIHVIMKGIGKDRKTRSARSIMFHTQDFAYLQERGRAHSEYEFLRLLTETTWELDQHDMISNEAL